MVAATARRGFDFHGPHPKGYWRVRFWDTGEMKYYVIGRTDEFPTEEEAQEFAARQLKLMERNWPLQYRVQMDPESRSEGLDHAYVIDPAGYEKRVR